MLHGEHSAILLTFIKLPFVIKIFVLSSFEWRLKTGFTVYCLDCDIPNCTFNVPMLKYICLDFDITVPMLKFIYCWDYNGHMLK